MWQLLCNCSHVTTKSDKICAVLNAVYTCIPVMHLLRLHNWYLFINTLNTFALSRLLGYNSFLNSCSSPDDLFSSFDVICEIKGKNLTYRLKKSLPGRILTGESSWKVGRYPQTRFDYEIELGRYSMLKAWHLSLESVEQGCWCLEDLIQ